MSKQTALFVNGQNQIIPFAIQNEDDSDEIQKLREEVLKLQLQLGYEKQLKQKTQEELDLLKPKQRKRRTQEELDAIEEGYSEFKSNGVKKPSPAESIRSYDDFVAIQNYLLSKPTKYAVRDWAIWTVGVSLGLRISDLFKLKIKDVLNPNLTFRERIRVIEKKTSKLNNCLLTEAVVEALRKYFDTLEWKLDQEDYVFRSQKKGKLEPRYGWKIISTAGKDLNLPLNISSHTMRKSFANIAACVDRDSIDMNSITKIQGLLNHSDQRVTMRYLGTYQDMFDRARIAVSDFVLGKTDVNELRAGSSCTIDDVLSRLDSLETKFFGAKGE